MFISFPHFIDHPGMMVSPIYDNNLNFGPDVLWQEFHLNCDWIVILTIEIYSEKKGSVGNNSVSNGKTNEKHTIIEKQQKCKQEY